MTKQVQDRLYKICTVIILAGFLMLIQPLSIVLFTWGLPVMIAGIIVHIILDHWPEPRHEQVEESQQ